LACNYLHLAVRRYARNTLIFALMAWIGVASLPPTAADFHACGGTDLHQFQTARYALWAVPTRLSGHHSAPRVASCSEEESETKSKTSPSARGFVNASSKRDAIAISQSLSVISPDRLIELPGTPPPPLRL
jgi:hypothetical protein